MNIAHPSRPISLHGKCVTVDRLSDDLRRAMQDLFMTTYDGVDSAKFQSDLAAKSHVLLIYDSDDRLRGFSTIVVWNHSFNGRRINLLFSGDTVIERGAWGHMALVVSFLKFFGANDAAEPDMPLYWLLTTKGHRTYRYLPLMFKHFWPNWKDDRQTELDGELAKDVGNAFFPGSFDAERGIVALQGHYERLKPEFAIVPKKDMKRTDVRYFLERNPNYASGEELLCLVRLSEENVRHGLLRYFLRGTQSGILGA